MRWVEQFDVDFVGKFPCAKVYSGSATTDDGPGDFTWPEKIFLLVRVDPYLIRKMKIEKASIICWVLRT